MEGGEIKLVDYSSSEGEDLEDLAEGNNRNGDVENLEEDVTKSGENDGKPSNRINLSNVAVVQPLVHGTLQNEDSDSQGTVSQFEESDVNFEDGLDQDLEQMFEYSNSENESSEAPPSSPTNNSVPMSNPINFLDAFQAFLNVEKSAESSNYSSDGSVEQNESSPFVNVSSDDSQNTEVYTPPQFTEMSTHMSDNESEPIVIHDSFSDTTGMYSLNYFISYLKLKKKYLLLYPNYLNKKLIYIFIDDTLPSLPPPESPRHSYPAGHYFLPTFSDESNSPESPLDLTSPESPLDLTSPRDSPIPETNSPMEVDSTHQQVSQPNETSTTAENVSASTSTSVSNDPPPPPYNR